MLIRIIQLPQTSQEMSMHWKQLNAKAEFVLKRSISHDLFNQIIRCKSAHEIWHTLDRPFNKKDEARFQILKNEFSNTTQGNLSIFRVFF